MSETQDTELWSVKLKGRTVKFELPVPPDNFKEEGQRIIARLKAYLESEVEMKYKRDKVAFVGKVFAEAANDRTLGSLKVRIDWYPTKSGPYRPEVKLYAMFVGDVTTYETYQYSPGYCIGSNTLTQALNHMFLHGEQAAVFAVAACRVATELTDKKVSELIGWNAGVYDVVPRFDCSSGDGAFTSAMGRMHLNQSNYMQGKFFTGMDFQHIMI